MKKLHSRQLNWALLLLLGACADLDVGAHKVRVPDAGSTDTAGPAVVALQGQKLHKPKRLFLNGEPAAAYEFGPVSFLKGARANPDEALSGRASGAAPVFPMYFFFNEQGDPLFAAPTKDAGTGQFFMAGGEGTGQRPIIDVLPNAADERGEAYSGLWEIVKVVVPNNYAIDSLRDAAAIRAMGSGPAPQLKLMPSGFAINCPVVEAASHVTPSVATYAANERRIPQPQMELWFRGQRVDCFLVNGWETLGATAAGEVPGPDSYALFRADQDELRVQTFDLTVVPAATGRPRAVNAPVGIMFVPQASIQEASIDFQDLALLSGQPPRRRKTDPAGYRPVRWVWAAAVNASNDNALTEARLAADGLLDPARWDPKRFSPRAGPVLVNLGLSGLAAIPCEEATSPASDPCRASGLVCTARMGGGQASCALPEVRFGALCGPAVAVCRSDTNVRGPFTPADDVIETWLDLGGNFPSAHPPEWNARLSRLAPDFIAAYKKNPFFPRAPIYSCLANESGLGRCAIGCRAEDRNQAEGQTLKQVVTDKDGADVTITLPLDSRCGGQWMPGYTCDRESRVCIRACNPDEATATQTCQVATDILLSDSQAQPDLAKGNVCTRLKSFNACLQPIPAQGPLESHKEGSAQ